MCEPRPQRPPECAEVYSPVVVRKSIELLQAFGQQRPRAVKVALLVMIESGGRLHDSMIEGSLRPRRRPPHAFQQLMTFKVEPGVEERDAAPEFALRIPYCFQRQVRKQVFEVDVRHGPSEALRQTEGCDGGGKCGGLAGRRGAGGACADERRRLGGGGDHGLYRLGEWNRAIA